MRLLHNISYEYVGSNYNLPEEVEMCNDQLSFDGIYYNVYLNQQLLEGKDVTLFVMGDHVGGNNSFDIGQPFEKFCDWNQIMDLVTIYGCKLGWHTWSHPDLTQLSDKEIIRECLPPFPMDYFAYPYGKWDDRVVEIVKALGYKKAYSVTETDGTDFTIPRAYL